MASPRLASEAPVSSTGPGRAAVRWLATVQSATAGATSQAGAAWRRLTGGAETATRARAEGGRRVSSSGRELAYDLFTQVSYMASLSTARVTRSALFTKAASLDLSSSSYFAEINTLVNRLSYDYPEACRSVAKRATDPDVSGLLLRMAGSMASGEDEAEFLTREAAVLAELYKAKYERDVESLRKWTDAYAALSVSAALIVIISIISMMIYSFGLPMIIGLSFTTVAVMGIGAWVIHVAAPNESFTRAAGLSSREQKLALLLMRTVAPVGAVMASLVWALGGGLGWPMIIGGAALLPAGFVISRDAAKMARRDRDIATMTRLLGGVTSAIGTTVADAIGNVDRRSMASLAPDVRRLEIRMNAGISQDLCWKRFVEETGSELIERTVRIFWDGITLGGEAGRTGMNAAFFASTISLLREKRALVSGTFGYLVMPLHAAMTGLLIFIVNVMGLFSTTLLQASPELQGGVPGAPVQAAGIGAFGDVNLGFMNALVMFVVVGITISSGVVPRAATGGHRLRIASALGIMLIISGALIAFLPGLAQAMFDTITAPIE